MIESIVVGILALIGAFLYGGKKKQDEIKVQALEKKQEQINHVESIKADVEKSDLADLVKSNNDKFGKS